MENPSYHLFEGVAGNSSASHFGKEKEVKHVFKSFFFVLLLGVMISLTGCATPIVEAPPETVVDVPAEQPSESEAEPEIPVTVLELVKEGESVFFTMDQLKALPSAEGLAGIMSSTGKITAPAIYKGVPVSTLLEEVGGMTDDHSVEIIAEDGYSITYSPSQIRDGEYITYDVSSGDEMEKIGELQTIIAYEREGEALDQNMDGQLRLVMVGESPLQVVDGHWSIKYVNKVVLKEAIEDWVVDFIGAIDEPMDRATFESGAADDCHKRTWVDEDGQEWEGIPLYYLIGRVDDEVKHGDDAYRDDLAKAGYTIDLVSADGYTVTLDSYTVMRDDDIIVAYLVDGEPLSGEDFPLRLVGPELSKKQMVGGIVKVQINFEPVAEATEEVIPEATSEPVAGETPAVVGPDDASVLIKGLVDAEKTLTMQDLLGMAVLNLNVTHPKGDQIDVTGILMKDILAQVSIPAEATTLVLTASDGYTSEVSLADVLACETCLLGWDEEMLRTYMPGFESSSWVKDLAEIEVK